MTLRLGVIGNCQGGGFARSLRQLLPQAKVSVFRRSTLKTAAGEEKAGWLRELAEADTVFSVPLNGGYGDFGSESMARTSRHFVPFPYIAFSGYQPDCTYIRSGAKELRGPMGSYHSALCAGAFLEGLSPERTVGLFNAYAFASLGYFARFADAADTLRQSAGKLGYDMEPVLRGAPFMHTINHPAVAAIHTVVRQALDRAGIAYDPERAMAMPEDDLAAGPVWPLYPEILHALGREGGAYAFARRGQGEAMGLAEFVAESFKAFQAATEPLVAASVDRARAFLRSELVPLPG